MFAKTSNLIMSASRETHAVFGYVRTKYHRNVPEAIIRLCLQYFDQNSCLVFRRNPLKQLLSLKEGKCYTHAIKFNQDLSFSFQVVPSLSKDKKFALGFLNKSMSDAIDYAIICAEISCKQGPFQANIKVCRKKNHQNKSNWHYQFVGYSSQFNTDGILLFNFKILSAQIKYEDNGLIYYPSLNAV